MARRVGGVAIVDTPEVKLLRPLQPNDAQIKGLGDGGADLSHIVANTQRGSGGYLSGFVQLTR
jgi:hypothetical protein